MLGDVSTADTLEKGYTSASVLIYYVRSNTVYVYSVYLYTMYVYMVCVYAVVSGHLANGHLANGHLANGHLANICRGTFSQHSKFSSYIYMYIVIFFSLCMFC